MAPAEKPGDGEPGEAGDPGDVLSNLPRSRRQRPSARRQEARESREAGSPVGAGAGAPVEPDRPAKAGSGDPQETPGPREQARRRVPASGYATAREPGSYGNADPDELLKSFVRSILRRLPG